MFCAMTRILLATLLLVTTGGAQTRDAPDPKWTVYHDTAAAHGMLEEWSVRHPRLCRLIDIGRTLKGTPLLVLEITNQDTGSGDTKPGYYYDGNIHSSELTGCEVVLRFADHVLTSYSRGHERSKRLLDTRVLYLRPKFNPDGADLALHTIHGPRSTPRPYDQDADGLLDEDPPNDLDGDGFATRMRRQNPKGAWRTHSEEPSLMVRRRKGDKDGPFYDVWSEGIDDDGDGEINEDGVGGIDMNRNFPRNWGMEFEQRGAGPYPLSEPETRATVEFFQSHKNITGAFHGHTSGGFLYRLPSTAPWDTFHPLDQALITELADGYANTTGQPVRPSYTNPKVHRHGTLISWLYWDRGMVGTVPEFWGGIRSSADPKKRASELERFRYDRDHLGSAHFAPWKKIQHPALGEVEVGGWRGRFISSNPPPSLLSEETARYIPWMVQLAEVAPRVELEDLKVAALGDDRYEVIATARNTGYLPTFLTQRALDSEIAVPVRALLTMHGAKLVSGDGRGVMGHLVGQRHGLRAIKRSGPAASSATVRWLVKKTAASATVTVTVVSEKGGVARETAPLR